MTAYISRLLSRQGPPTGIRPRPRSRYEPEPDTYLARDPIEIDREPVDVDDLSRPQGTRSFHAADNPADTVRPAEAVSAQTISVPHQPGPEAASRRPTPPAPAQRGDNDQPNRRSGGQTSTAPHVSATVGPQAPDEPPAHPSNSHTPAPAVAPRPHAGEDRRTENVTGPKHSANAPVSTTEPAQDELSSRRPDLPHASRPAAPSAPEPGHSPATPWPAEPKSARPWAADPIDKPAQPEPGDEGQGLRSDATYAHRLQQSATRSVDPVLRQTIINAIAEPGRADTTEVTVHIDRIDVRAPSSTPSAAAEPRRARATPTSLESYLRSRSRRAAR
jgi:hypothetical protein